MKKTAALLLTALLLGLCACGPASEAPVDAETSATTADTTRTESPSPESAAEDTPSSASTSAPATSTVKTFASKPREIPSITPANTQKFTTPAAAANDFAFRLSSLLLAKNGKKNFVSSPFSVWLPLAALLNATDAEHKPALINALSAKGFSEKEINKAAAEMLNQLTNGYSRSNPLRIANAIFVQENVSLQPEFSSIFAESYHGSVESVEFTAPSAKKTINDWVSRNTEGRIKNFVDELDPEAVAVIINAIYFANIWERSFSTELTEEGSFHGVNGDSTAQFMRKESAVMPYYEDDKLQAASLNFATDGGLYLLLPKSGTANGLLASMTSAYFENIYHNSASVSGELRLPRFAIDSGEMKLLDTLAALGVPLVTPNSITGLVKGSLYISDALQKAVIEVDEKGTTAAAATAMTMKSSMPAASQHQEPFRMICDKPFAFVLYGRGGQVLFTGVVNQAGE